MGYMDHEKGKELLLELGNILDYISLPCFLMQGTCLGAIRDKGFVPTEKDIDLGFLGEHFRYSVKTLCTELKDNKWKVETKHRSHPFPYCHTVVCYKEWIKADLVSWHVWKDSRFAIAPTDVEAVPHRYALVHPKEIIENWSTVELFGRSWNTPSPVEEYLQREYDDWKTPREDHVSRCRVYDFLEKEKVPYDHWG